VEPVADRPDLESARTAAISHARLSATSEARRAAIPPNPTLDIVDINKQLREVRQLREDLERGPGVWADTAAGRAGRDLAEARRSATRSSRLDETASGWRERRFHRKEAAIWTEREAEALGRWCAYGEPEASRLDGLIAKGENAGKELGRRRDLRSPSFDEFSRYRSSSARTLDELQRDIESLRDHRDGVESPLVARSRVERSVLRPRGGLDYHGDGVISRDLGHGLGR
jgi:hypothetical protein